METKNLLFDNSGQQLLNETKVDSYLEIFNNFIRDFIQWWYVQMPIWHLRALRRIVIFLDDNLSFSLLLKNFFVPWHRDKNAIGYLIGITSKVIYLPIAFIIIATFTTTYIFFIFFWLLLPPSTVVLIIRSFWM
ncbi:MAG: transmembrane(s)protein [candidate division WS6 bacterium 34_10]|uniref:Transmembrane(S)protein n=1 Tax=candidate division WS6 bacterium 34_10 TaxID=1641389 RepID=A0A101HFI7_9BACT|nr:MAG: transmembrane(s)protein [candidate division WS6 bacterium 34_10]